jgi:hypothetical protein
VIFFDAVICFSTENVKGKNGLLMCSSAQSWVSSVAVCRGSDLAASGAACGTVRLWALEPESKGIHPLYNFPLVSEIFFVSNQMTCYMNLLDVNSFFIY